MEGAVYLPEVVGGGYRAFWDCRTRYRVVKGGKASKKSATTALWYIYHLMKYPGANLLVVRNVHRTHADSTYAQLRWAIRRLEVEHLWRAGREPLELTYTPTGQRILFRGLDNVEKLASTTVEQGYLCWVWLEEAFEIARQEDFEKLDLSVPRGEVPPPLFKQTTVTFNPWNEHHWLKSRFFDRPDPQVFAITTDYRCNEFLDATDRAVYERMRQENPRLAENVSAMAFISRFANSSTGLPLPSSSALLIIHLSVQSPASGCMMMPSSSAAANAAAGGAQEWKRIALTPSSSLRVRSIFLQSSTSIHGMPSFAKFVFSTLPRSTIFTPLRVKRCPSVPTVRNPNRIRCVKSAASSLRTSV